MSKPRYLRIGKPSVDAPQTPCDFVPETEAEQARRQMRDWLRDRPEEDWDFDDDSMVSA